ncbi:MAG TPA: V-type ATP synthase subunit E, partial [Spirochaetia bacterium]|nr:V-type ATP synthase subunit E [Spirochaetia bacterium]
LLSDAQMRKQGILESADRESERIKTDAVRAVDREVEVTIAGKTGTVRMETRAHRVIAAHDVVEAVFVRVRELVDALSGVEYQKVLSGLIREAVAFIPGGGTLRVRTQDLEVGKRIVVELPGEWEVQGVEAPQGTVIATDRANSRRADNSFQTRLLRAERALRDEVSRDLLGLETESSA